MPYNSDFVCTYKMMPDIEDQDTLYRIQLLQALGINEWHDEAVSKTIRMAYEQFHTAPAMQQILIKAKAAPNLLWLAVLFESPPVIVDLQVFAALFMFDYFDVMHRCLCDLFNRGDVQANHLEEFMRLLELESVTAKKK